MESLKRTLMLLRPFGIKTETGKIGGVLKLQSAEAGISLTLKTDVLGEGDYFLYLFLINGKELYAGDIAGGILSVSLQGIALENITGAAVVHRNRANYDFVLRSTGPDWPSLIARFKMEKSPRPAEAAADNVSHTKAAGENYAPEPVLAGQTSEDSGSEKDIIADKIDNMVKEVYTQQDIERSPGVEEPLEKEHLPGIEEAGCDACPHALREARVNPFPAVFPGSEWVKISYPGPAGWWHYISGKIYKGGVVAAEALGVPGEYGMTPPVWLEGFGTYLRCAAEDARGYWLMFQDAETGEVLDMGLSPHGA